MTEHDYLEPGEARRLVALETLAEQQAGGGGRRAGAKDQMDTNPLLIRAQERLGTMKTPDRRRYLQSRGWRHQGGTLGTWQRAGHDEDPRTLEDACLQQLQEDGA